MEKIEGMAQKNVGPVTVSVELKNYSGVIFSIKKLSRFRNLDPDSSLLTFFWFWSNFYVDSDFSWTCAKAFSRLIGTYQFRLKIRSIRPKIFFFYNFHRFTKLYTGPGRLNLFYMHFPSITESALTCRMLLRLIWIFSRHWAEKQ